MVELAAPSPRARAVEICDVDELWDGEMQRCSAGDTPILLVKIDGRFHAYQAHCPHQGAALAEGELDGAVLTCSAHGWQFDATNGHGVNPRTACLKRFAVQVIGRKVFVEVEIGDGGLDRQPRVDARAIKTGGAHDGP